MRRVPYARGAGRGGCDAADSDHGAPGGNRVEKAETGVDLAPGRRAIRAMRARMGRDDVPEQDVVIEPVLGENAVDDRRRRLGRPGSRQLPLGREGESGDTCTAIAGRLAD